MHVQLSQHQRARLVAPAPRGDVLCLSAVSLLDSVTVACGVVKPRDDREKYDSKNCDHVVIFKKNVAVKAVISID